MQIEQLGPYKIGRKLGRGGMGTVYEGIEIATGELVAVKVLSAAMSQDEGFRERFEAEIESLDKLRHPNIVRLIAFGEQLGLMFYAMELVKGTSLDDELQAGRRFDWRQTTQIGIKISRALKHAHDHGVIHRDIKPANLLLGVGDEIKLSDFGIAKLFYSSGMTADGGVLGTAEYMAPEQADGRPVTLRADLYSLGGVLYALLAGRPPFKAKSIPEMLQLQRFAQPEPLRHLCPDVPEELATIIEQLLEKEPEKRIANAMLLARRLEAMEHGLSVRKPESLLAKPATLVGSEPGMLRPISPSSYQLGPVDPMAVTRSETQRVDAAVLAKELNAARLDVTRGTGEVADLAISKLPENPTAPPTTVRFTSVRDREEEQQTSYREMLAALVSPQTWAIVGCLVLVGLLARYMIKPTGADKLYERIMTIRNQNDESRFSDAEPDIQEFSTYYAADPRLREIDEFADEIKLVREERRFEVRLKWQHNRRPFLPVERAYAEAVKVAQLDPHQGAEQLESLLAVYSDAPESDSSRDPVKVCLRLARENLQRFRLRAAQYASDDLTAIKERMDHAEQIQETEAAQAQNIWQGIVSLYGEKPWCKEVVERARQKLAGPNVASQPDDEP